jgi:hypothetical protein
MSSTQLRRLSEALIVASARGPRQFGAEGLFFSFLFLLQSPDLEHDF